MTVVLGLATLLGTELALRALGFGPRPVPFRLRDSEPPASDPRLVTHPDRVYALAPHQRALPSHAGRYATEAWPFRGRPPFPAPEGTRRVIFLGESCVFGTGVDPSQTLPHLVWLELSRADSALASVQVINLGVPGYSLVQVREVLRDALEELDPVAAVFYVGAWNDQAPVVRLDDVELIGGGRGWRRLIHSSALLSCLFRGVPEPSFLSEAEPLGPTDRAFRRSSSPSC